MSDVWQGPGWWLASDGKWYPADAESGAVYEGEITNATTETAAPVADPAAAAPVANAVAATPVAPVEPTPVVPTQPAPVAPAPVVDAITAEPAVVEPAATAQPITFEPITPAPVAPVEPVVAAEAVVSEPEVAAAPIAFEPIVPTEPIVAADPVVIEPIAAQPLAVDPVATVPVVEDLPVVEDVPVVGAPAFTQPEPFFEPEPVVPATPVAETATAPIVDTPAEQGGWQAVETDPTVSDEKWTNAEPSASPFASGVAPDTPAMETPAPAFAPIEQSPIIPDVQMPEAANPEAPSIPDVQMPEAAIPEAPSIPDVSAPDVSAPDASAPDLGTVPLQPYEPPTTTPIERTDAWRTPSDTGATSGEIGLSPANSSPPDVVDLAVPEPSPAPTVESGGPNWSIIGGIAASFVLIGAIIWLALQLFSNDGSSSDTATTDPVATETTVAEEAPAVDGEPAIDGEGPNLISVFAIRAGNCIIGDITGQVLQVELVDCDVPHDFEVYREAIVDESITEFDEAAISAFAEDVCRSSLAPLIRTGDDRVINFKFFQPTRDSWNEEENPDRLVTCLAFDEDADLVGRINDELDE